MTTSTSTEPQIIIEDSSHDDGLQWRFSQFLTSTGRLIDVGIQVLSTSTG